MPATLERPRQMLGGINPRERFPEDEFTHIPQVLVFREHKTKSAKGRELNFGQHELLLVANRCNERIRTSGDYAGVTIGHNPTRDEKAQGAVSPPLIGYAGPFRCMPIPGGQRFGIFCDFWIQNEFVGELKRYPRRSAELWLEDRYDDMFLDPIACLGGEAPRLDMGLLYSRASFRGGNVEIYAAMAGADNVFIPSDDTPKKYQGETMNDQSQVAEIINAFMETPAMKWVLSKMAAEGGEAVPDEGAAPAAPATPPAAPPAPEAAKPDPPEVPGPGEQEKEPMKKPYQADDAMAEGMEDEKKNYEAGVATGTVEDKPANSAPASGSAESEVGPKRDAENYARANAENKRLRAELDAANEKLASESAMRINAQRKAKLIELHNMGYPFDVDSHAERVQYSKKSDAEFEAHCDMIVELSTPSIANRRLYVPKDAPTGIVNKTASGEKRERYSADQAKETVRICSELQAQGKTFRYEDVLDKVAAGKADELLK